MNMKPSTEIIEILYSGSVEKTKLANLVSDFTDTFSFINYRDFENKHSLNTPGPIYTTHTDNCGTGQVEAMNNVGGDADFHEIIFKQPYTKQELRETLSAAFVDPFGAYYFDGNLHWTKELIREWWSKSEERLLYIIQLYHDEINLPETVDRTLYGSRKAIPENYKNWLDFYQMYMKNYLEWYIEKLCTQKIILQDLKFDWTRKNELDHVLNSRKK